MAFRNHGSIQHYLSSLQNRILIPSQKAVHPEIQTYNTEQSAQCTAGSDAMSGCLNTAWNVKGPQRWYAPRVRIEPFLDVDWLQIELQESTKLVRNVGD